MEHNVEDEYDVSICQLQTLFMYWCHVCCLKFRRDNLVVDGWQMVSLVSVHGKGSLFNMYSLLHFSLVPVGFTGYYFGVLHEHWVSCGPAMVSYSFWFIQVCVFFESLAEFSLGFTYVCVAVVDVTRDVIDDSTLVFFRCFVFRVYYHWAEGVRRFVVQVCVMWLINPAKRFR